MNKMLLQLASFWGVFMAAGSLYFLCLVMHVPFIVFAAISLGGIYIFGTQMAKFTGEDVRKNQLPLYSTLILLTAIAKMLWTSSQFYSPHGEWDAWALWDYHAHFLSTQDWQQLYQTKTCNHTDYPNGLPAIIAVIWRVTGNTTPLAPLIISWTAMLSIPVLIFCAVGRKNILVASIPLLYFCTSESYLHKGISGYADTLLALLFLAAILCAEEYRESGRKAMMIICGLCAGGAAWTKNEGLMLVLIFILFYAKLFFKRKNVFPFIIGMALPALALLVHKILFAPANDLIGSQDHSTAMLLDESRLETILTFFYRLMWEWFRPVVILAGAYAVYCMVRRRLPSRLVVLVLTCLAGYIVVYMITPYSLEWHLATSMDRLVHQLVPVFLYAVCMDIWEKRRSHYSPQPFISKDLSTSIPSVAGNSIAVIC